MDQTTIRTIQRKIAVAYVKSKIVGKYKKEIKEDAPKNAANGWGKFRKLGSQLKLS